MSQPAKHNNNLAKARPSPVKARPALEKENAPDKAKPALDKDSAPDKAKQGPDEAKVNVPEAALAGAILTKVSV